MVRPLQAGRGGARKPGGLPPARAEPGLHGAASGTCPQRLDTGLGMDPGASPAQGVLQVPRGRAFAAARPTELTPEADQLDDYKRCSVLQKQPGTEEGDRRLSERAPGIPRKGEIFCEKWEKFHGKGPAGPRQCGRRVWGQR